MSQRSVAKPIVAGTVATQMDFEVLFPDLPRLFFATAAVFAAAAPPLAALPVRYPHQIAPRASQAQNLAQAALTAAQTLQAIVCTPTRTVPAWLAFS
eukprot:COSAG02_NODE_5195_length_4551_cov_1.826370_6_plen_97_part_00